MVARGLFAQVLPLFLYCLLIKCVEGAGGGIQRALTLYGDVTTKAPIKGIRYHTLTNHQSVFYRHPTKKVFSNSVFRVLVFVSIRRAAHESVVNGMLPLMVNTAELYTCICWIHLH